MALVFLGFPLIHIAGRDDPYQFASDRKCNKKQPACRSLSQSLIPPFSFGVDRVAANHKRFVEE